MKIEPSISPNQELPPYARPNHPPPALNVFAAHRSIRHYLPQPLAPGHLDLIVEAGRRAPTDAQGHMYALIRITG